MKSAAKVKSKRLNQAFLLALLFSFFSGYWVQGASNGCVPLPWGLVGWWAGEGDTSDRVSGNTGEAHDGVSYVAGETGSAFQFDGTGFVRIPAASNLNVGLRQGLTVECWIKPASLSSNQQPIVEWNNGPNPGVHLWISVAYFAGQGGPGAVFANIVDTDGTTHALVSAPGLLSTNEFSHIAVTYSKDSGIGTLYVNGSIVYTYNLGIFTPQTSYDLLLGRRPPASFNAANFRGLLDEVSLYDRPLTESEILAIYTAGRAGKCTVPVVIQQPIDQTASPGGTVGFVATVIGLPPLYNQWSFNGAPLIVGADPSIIFTNIQLGTFQEYAVVTLTNAQRAQAGIYSLQVTNAYGAVTTSNAVLSVPSSGYCSNAPFGMVSWFRGEGTAADELNNNLGELIGNASYNKGEVGEGFELDGTTGYIRVPASPSLDIGLGTGLTVECWIKPKDLANYQPIVEWNNGSTHGVHLWISEPYWANQGGPGALFANIVDDQGGTHALVCNPGILTTNDFNHIAVTYDKSSGIGTLYINANVVYTYNLGTFTPQTSYDLLFGRRPPPTPYPAYYGGILDEVSLYNRALTGSEISSVYLAGTAGKCRPQPILPYILTQPSSQVITQGNGSYFTVLAVGSSPLTYQWQFNRTNLLGATSSSLVLTNVQIVQAGDYRVIVTNSYGSVLSSNALLQVQLPPCANPSSGLVSWLSAEGNAASLVDNDQGLLHGGVSFELGEVGQAFRFDGNSGYVSIPTSPNLNVGLAGGFTVECWIKPKDLSSFQPILEWDDGSALGVGIWISLPWFEQQGGPGDVVADIKDIYGGTHALVSAPGLLNADEFQHVAVTYDKASGMGNLFLNGEVVDFHNLGNFTPQTSFDLNLAHRPSPAPFPVYYQGLLDEVSLYNRALSGAEINAVYLAGAAGKCSSGPVPPKIVAVPTSQSVETGQNATFSVMAVGTPPLRYQWFFAGAQIQFATNAALILSNVQPSQSGYYAVLVSNSQGGAMDTNAFLDVTNRLPQCVPAPSGLACWWNAESNTTDNISGNQGIAMNGATFASGIVGTAFSFDGIGASIQVPDSPSLRFTNALTFEAWIYPLTTGGHHQEILSKWDGGTGHSYTFTIVPDGRFACGLCSDGGGSTLAAFSLNTVPTNTWTHVAGVYDGTGLSVYVNGILNATVPWTLGIFPGDTPLVIGSTLNSGSFFNGLIDEVSLYGRALTGVEIHAIYEAGAAGKCPTGLSPYVVTQPASQIVVEGDIATFNVVAAGSPPLNYRWLFNGAVLPGAISRTLTLTNVMRSQAGGYSVSVANAYGSVTSVVASLIVNTSPICTTAPTGLTCFWKAESNATDIVSGNQGVLINGATFAPGKVGQAFSFDGIGALIQVPDAPSLHFTNALTFEAWIYPRTTGGHHQEILSKWDGGDNQYSYTFTIVPDGRFAGGLSSGGAVSTVAGFSLNTVPTNTWTHVAGAYDGQGLSIYVNGILNSTVPWTQGIFPGTAPLVIGSTLNSGSFFNGLIDEVSLYSRALTGSEIQAIYQAGKAGKCLTGGVPPYIWLQPTNASVNVGEVVTFGAGVGGTMPLGFQWRLNGTNIPGATQNELTLTDVQVGQAGAYAVLVNNVFGSVLSSNALLTVNQAPCVPVPPGLISWWPGNGNVNDVAGVNPGVSFNGVSFLAGEVGNAFAFDGVGGHIRVANQANLNPTNAMSIEAWINPANLNNQQVIVTKWDMVFSINQRSYSLGVYAGGQLNFNVTPDGLSLYRVISTNRLPANQWSHVAATYDGESLQIFVNGLSWGRLDYHLGIYPGYDDLAIGAAVGGLPVGQVGYPFAGQIDEPSIYSQALTPDQIQAIYRAGRTGKCLPSLAAPSIVSQPLDQNVQVGGTAGFTVTAAGTLPLNYQWNFNGIAIPGATLPSLNLTNVQLSQVGLYSVSVTNQIGSTTSSNAVLSVILPSATLQTVAVTNVPAGGIFSIPITLLANGNENAVSWSLNFDPAALNLLDISVGSAAARGTLLANTTQTNSGRLGIAISLPTGASFAAGMRELAVVTFIAGALPQETTTAISFGDQPVRRQVSDTLALPLTANYSGGTVVIAAGSFEGDVTPRPEGDHALTVTDWVLVGRYAARLDSPTNSSEFQRADCAPRATLGNGIITVSDWVQAGRYAAGLDPATLVGGPTENRHPNVVSLSSSEVSRKKDGSPSRVIKISESTIIEAKHATVSVNLISQGDENALGFSVSFDPAVLKYTGTSLGSNAGEALFDLNATQAPAGVLGLALALPVGKNFEAGSREVAKLDFDVLPNASGKYPISFKDEPVPREIANANAVTLTAGYIDGTVVINPAPLLNCVRTGQNLILAWPSWGTNYVLQHANSLDPASKWTTLSSQTTVVGDQMKLKLPISDITSFYRLVKP